VEERGRLQGALGELIAKTAEFTAPAGSLDAADSAETRLLREQVSQLSAENERLRLQVVASEVPAAGDLIRSDEGDDHAAHSPPASRRELGVLLRASREARGITIEEAAERLLCSPGKINRMESSFRSGTLRDVRDLCDFYGVTEQAQRRQPAVLVLCHRAARPWRTAAAIARARRRPAAGQYAVLSPYRQPTATGSDGAWGCEGPA
jgi:transcriptional regulator with XRE-family HTH domain